MPLGWLVPADRLNRVGIVGAITFATVLGGNAIAFAPVLGRGAARPPCLVRGASRCNECELVHEQRADGEADSDTV